jgi:hypothetical protein
MHKEVLNPQQIEVLPLVEKFKREFYLVGGTAIALQIGHRRSVDFDLFKATSLKSLKIVNTVKSFSFPYSITRNVSEQLNMVINDVKFTFFQYPFEINATLHKSNIARIPDLLDLAAMKAYALGRRSKWKDYVDMYFLLKDHFTISQISEKATTIFGELYSEKMLRAQLCFFNDIDYSEPVEFMKDEISDQQITAFLKDISINLDTDQKAQGN